jgi:hypothetical protein
LKTVQAFMLLAFPLALAGLWLLRWPRIRGTTLVAPWIWASVSLCTLTAVELALSLAGEAGPTWAPAARYAAAMSTFTPIMALLGAKRPQDRGWQWIVLTLWIILCQPAGEWLLFGGVAEIHPARFWFQMILVVVGATNGLGTKNWLASALYCGGQVLLLLPFHSVEPPLAANTAAFWGLAGIFLSAVSVTATGVSQRELRGSLDRVWVDFRDEFGVVWALRILERVNASATMYDWPLHLTWQGFRERESASNEIPSLVEESFRTLLRRFVSAEWIDERLALENPAASDRTSAP